MIKVCLPFTFVCAGYWLISAYDFALPSDHLRMRFQNKPCYVPVFLQSPCVAYLNWRLSSPCQTPPEVPYFMFIYRLTQRHSTLANSMIFAAPNLQSEWIKGKVQTNSIKFLCKQAFSFILAQHFIIILYFRRYLWWDLHVTVRHLHIKSQPRTIPNCCGWNCSFLGGDLFVPEFPFLAMAPWESVPSAREVVSQLQASGGEKDAKGLSAWDLTSPLPWGIRNWLLEKNGTREVDEVGF